MHLTVDINVRFVPDAETTRKLDQILAALNSERKEEKTMFEDLIKDVTDLTNAADAQTAVLVNVKQKLDTIIAGGGLSPQAQQQLTDLATAIVAEKDKIVAATLANTPAADVPPAAAPPAAAPVDTGGTAPQ